MSVCDVFVGVGSGLANAQEKTCENPQLLPSCYLAFHSLFKQNLKFFLMPFLFSLTRVPFYSPSLRAAPRYLLKSSKRQGRRRETDCCSVCSRSLLLPHIPQERETKTRMERKIERVCVRFAFLVLVLLAEGFEGWRMLYFVVQKRGWILEWVKMKLRCVCLEDLWALCFFLILLISTLCYSIMGKDKLSIPYITV